MIEYGRILPYNTPEGSIAYVNPGGGSRFKRAFKTNLNISIVSRLLGGIQFHGP
jgi:hypothetical protein